MHSQPKLRCIPINQARLLITHHEGGSELCCSLEVNVTQLLNEVMSKKGLPVPSPHPATHCPSPMQISSGASPWYSAEACYPEKHLTSLIHFATLEAIVPPRGRARAAGRHGEPRRLLCAVRVILLSSSRAIGRQQG